MAAWLLWGAAGGAFELVTWLTGRADLTLSYQVWTLDALFPALQWVAVAGFGAAASVLAVHFWGRRAADG